MVPEGCERAECRAMAPLTAMPERIVAGTTVTLELGFPDHLPSDGWVLSLHLAGASTLTELSPTTTGDVFALDLSSSDTAGLAPGQYRYALRATNTGVIEQVAEGTLIVDADIAAATDGSLQSWAERTLAIVEAALAGKLTGGMAAYQILGRAVTHYSPAELMQLRAQLSAEVARQRPGGSSLRPIAITFTGR